MPLQKRVGELPAVATIVGTDQLIVSSANATKRCTVQQVGAFFQANGTYPPASHTHTASQITDFTSAVIAAAPPTTNASLLTSGTLADARLSGNVVLTNDARLSDARTPLAHTHTIANVTGLQAALDGKQAVGSYAATVHTHGISDVTGLQSALDGKAAASHTHAISNVTGLQSALDSKATPADVSSAVAAVVNAAPATLDTLKELADALGSDANFSTTVTNALAAKAPIANPTFTGTVSGVTKAMVGLGNVDNTSDANKPISTAVQAALNNFVSVEVFDDLSAVVFNHAHGNITNAGAIGSTSGQIVVTTTSGVLTTAASLGWSLISSTPTTLSGYGITDAVASNDSRLTDARTPTAHKSSHATGGTDALSPADIGAATAAHSHLLSSITDAGTAASRNAPATGNAASAEVVLGSDTRLSDARTPLSHTHSVGDITATGTPSASTFLRGDGAWAAAGSSSASDLTSGTLANARLTTRARASMNLYLWSNFR